MSLAEKVELAQIKQRLAEIEKQIAPINAKIRPLAKKLAKYEKPIHVASLRLAKIGGEVVQARHLLDEARNELQALRTGIVAKLEGDESVLLAKREWNNARIAMEERRDEVLEEIIKQKSYRDAPRSAVELRERYRRMYETIRQWKEEKRETTEFEPQLEEAKADAEDQEMVVKELKQKALGADQVYVDASKSIDEAWNKVLAARAGVSVGGDNRELVAANRVYASARRVLDDLVRKQRLAKVELAKANSAYSRATPAIRSRRSELLGLRRIATRLNVEKKQLTTRRRILDPPPPKKKRRKKGRKK